MIVPYLTAAKYEAYFHERESLKRDIEKAVLLLDSGIQLRGSWKYNDFHLLPQANYTYSDIDLLAPAYLEPFKRDITETAKELFSPIIRTKVSIHFKDDLSSISMEDSKHKNVFEYLMYYRWAVQNNTNPSEYYKAKVLMLILRKSENEHRFIEIVGSYKGKWIENLYAIKIGTERKIMIKQLRAALFDLNEELPIDFFKNCIEGNPDYDYCKKSSERFFSSSTVSDWLKSYIWAKTNYL